MSYHRWNPSGVPKSDAQADSPIRFLSFHTPLRRRQFVRQLGKLREGGKNDGEESQG